MSVTTLADLAARKGVSESSLPAGAQGWLDDAEVFCARIMGMSDGLAQITTGLWRVFEETDASVYIRCAFGPTWQIDSLEIAGVDRIADIYREWPWYIEMQEPVRGEVSAQSTIGWADWATMPEALKSSIILAYDNREVGNALPSGVASQRIGDFTISRESGGSTEAVTRIRNLLQVFAPPLVS